MAIFMFCGILVEFVNGFLCYRISKWLLIPGPCACRYAGRRDSDDPMIATIGAMDLYPGPDSALNADTTGDLRYCRL